jgi:hypothetical protein
MTTRWGGGGRAVAGLDWSAGDDGCTAESNEKGVDQHRDVLEKSGLYGFIACAVSMIVSVWTELKERLIESSSSC